jgi:hypothetical protein
MKQPKDLDGEVDRGHEQQRDGRRTVIGGAKDEVIHARLQSPRPIIERPTRRRKPSLKLIAG